MVIDQKLAAENVRIFGVLAPPQAFTDYGDIIVAGGILLAGEPATQDGFHTEDLKEAVGNDEPAYLLRFSFARKARAPFHESGDALKRVISRLPLQKIYRVHGVGLGSARAMLPYHDQAIRILVRHALEQYCIHDAENGRVGADAQCQGEHRH